MTTLADPHCNYWSSNTTTWTIGGPRRRKQRSCFTSVSPYSTPTSYPTVLYHTLRTHNTIPNFGRRSKTAANTAATPNRQACAITSTSSPQIYTPTASDNAEHLQQCLALPRGKTHQDTLRCYQLYKAPTKTSHNVHLTEHNATIKGSSSPPPGIHTPNL